MMQSSRLSLRSGWSTPWASALALAAFLLSVLPILMWYGRRVMDGSDEPLGVIALLAAVITLLVALRYGGRDHDRIRVLPLPMLIGALVLGGLQGFGVIRYPLLIGLLAVLVVSFSVMMPRGKAGLMALLVLSLPLMASLEFYVGYPLRLIAAEITESLLAVGGISVERAGVMLIDGDRLVGIDPPCAGVRMLWTASFVAAVLSARMRLSWIRTLLLLGAAVGCVVIGNGVRAALVFLPESGRVEWPEWAHPGVGLLIHGSVLVAVFGFASRLDVARAFQTGLSSSPKVRRLAVMAFGLLLVFVGTKVLAGGRFGKASEEVVEWPVMLDGIALNPQPLSPMEASFSRSFPGDIAKFVWADAEVILRKTDRATRMMHPSGDCLRAAGYEVHSEPVFRDADGRWWGASIALRDGKRWIVHERYVALDGDAALDASAWYWRAALHSEEGPWTAITVIRPDPEVLAGVFE